MLAWHPSTVPASKWRANKSRYVVRCMPLQNLLRPHIDFAARQPQLTGYESDSGDRRMPAAEWGMDGR